MSRRAMPLLPAATLAALLNPPRYAVRVRFRGAARSDGLLDFSVFLHRRWR